MGLTSTRAPLRMRESFCAQLETRSGQLGIACCVDAHGGAEKRARPARHRARERARDGLSGRVSFPPRAPLPQGSRTSESGFAPSFGVRSRLSRDPSPQGFPKPGLAPGLVLLGLERRHKVQQRGRLSPPRSGGQARGESTPFRRRTRAPRPAGPHPTLLPAGQNPDPYSGPGHSGFRELRFRFPSYSSLSFPHPEARGCRVCSPRPRAQPKLTSPKA